MAECVEQYREHNTPFTALFETHHGNFSIKPLPNRVHRLLKHPNRHAPLPLSPFVKCDAKPRFIILESTSLSSYRKAGTPPSSATSKHGNSFANPKLVWRLTREYKEHLNYALFKHKIPMSLPEYLNIKLMPEDEEPYGARTVLSLNGDDAAGFVCGLKSGCL